MKKMLFLFLLCVALIGCSAQPEGQTGQTASEASGDAAQDKELHFAFNAQPATLDTHFTTATATRDIGRTIYESLVTFNSNYEVVPMLAESFERSEDGKQVTFHLRKGVRFHNGKEMKAEDVVASMQKWQKQSAQAKSFLAGTEYEAKDDYTVVAHIPEPTSIDMFIFADLTQLAAIMPKEIVESAGEESVQEYVGTGPFQFVEWKKDQYIHFRKFADYQARSEAKDGMAGGKQALVDDLYIHFVTDTTTRLLGVQTGEYDIANRISHDYLETVESNENLKYVVISEEFPGLVFNKKAGLFANQKARQAVNAALDYEKMLIVAYGSDQFYDTNHALALKEQTNWYSEAGKEEYNTYDPELAKQLLKEAGYNGEEVVILTTRDYEQYYNLAVVAAEQLKAVGMNVKLEVYDWATVLERRQDEKAYDIFVSGWAFRPTPIQYPFLDSSANWPGWTNSKEIDGLIQNIKTAQSQEEAKKYAELLQKEMWQYLPILKVGDERHITVMRKGVEGFETLAGPILWNVAVKE
ncbi:ABC transporter substrate-binding protein [Brevibacillus marinus]|uniref:ABC transporter substrate-binding protein n=1 Tax=Brevibacillus marinus TaxID=2496837 RepID=UPI000F84C054|nr:ABC transporter substrate-binding protein [Brevibacillus marinus]